MAFSPPSRPTEGRLAIVTNAGRDAVDVRCAPDESVTLRTAKSCGPDAPTLASSSRIQSAGDGGKKARSPGRARNKLLKPLRREGRGRAQTVVATPAFFIDESNWSSASAGVFQPSVFLGRALRAVATADISSAL